MDFLAPCAPPLFYEHCYFGMGVKRLLIRPQSNLLYDQATCRCYIMACRCLLLIFGFVEWLSDCVILFKLFDSHIVYKRERLQISVVILQRAAVVRLFCIYYYYSQPYTVCLYTQLDPLHSKSFHHFNTTNKQVRINFHPFLCLSFIVNRNMNVRSVIWHCSKVQST